MDTLTQTRREHAALYDDRAAAERARTALLDIGIPATDIRLVLGETRTSDMSDNVTGTDGSEPKGFFQSLADLFMPDEDRSTYAEGLNRGGHLLTVMAGDDMSDAVLDILDDEGAVDMDDRVRQWQGEGWTAPDITSVGAGAAGGGMAGSSYGSSVMDRDQSLSGVAGAPGMAVRQAGTLSSGAMAGGPDATTEGRSAFDDDTLGTQDDDDSALRDITDDTTTGGPRSESGMGLGLGMASESGTRSDMDAGLEGGSSDLLGDRTGSQDLDTIRRVEERLTIGKRDVSHGRVRVRSYVVEEPVTADVLLHSERVQIDRRAVDRPVTDADDAFRDRTIEMEETGEEPVVSKTARVVEEIDLSKAVDEHSETVNDTVRRTEVEIEDERDDDTLRPLR